MTPAWARQEVSTIEAGRLGRRVRGESDAGTDSTAGQRDRPPPRLDNTEWFVIIPAEYNVKQLHKIGIYKVCAYCSNIDLLLGGERDARV